ncbi:MAG: hypothetical protein GF307_13135 [candidate division Zixibacteria bacterium]|nr:hypothetical protein [candidate division Zixibacteria bacterium]
MADNGNSNYYRVGIAGTINHDLVYGDDLIYEDLGGVLYNILGIHHLSGGKVQMKTAVNYGYDIESRLSGYLENIDSVDMEGLYRQPVKNPLVELRDIGQGGKIERLKYRVPALSLSKLSRLTDCDLILVNFISGRDIKTDTLQKLRAGFEGIIYIDIHSLTLGIKSDGHRYYRRPDNWKAVFECADIVQMNLIETLTMIGEPGMTIRETEDKEIDRIGKQIINYGPKIFILTLGSVGAKVFYSTSRGVKVHFANLKTSKPLSGEATGCGDLITSAFIVSLFSGAGIPGSLEYAVSIATEKYLRPGLTGVAELGVFRKEIPDKTMPGIGGILR